MKEPNIRLRALELKRFGYDGLRDAFEKMGIGEYAVVKSRSELGIAEDAFVVGMIGRLCFIKSKN